MLTSSLPDLLIDTIKAFRAETFFLTNHRTLHTIEQAIDFTNQCRYLFFWPIKDIVLPSLWVACAGDRPVPNEHDDPGHVTWGWKDSLLGKNKWYYGRILHKRNTIISLEMLPFFYSLSQNYGDFEQDYRDQYDQGLMTLEAKYVYEALLREGPLDTLTLRSKSHMAGPDSDSRFNTALTDLMTDFKIMPIGISDAGTWHYAYIYDIVARQMPELVDHARYISVITAQKTLVSQYFSLVGAAQARDVTKLFGWTNETTIKILSKLEQENIILKREYRTFRSSNWYFNTDLLISSL